MADLRYRALVSSDAAAYRKLRLKGLQEAPRAFGSDWARESEWDLAVFAERLSNQAGSVVTGAFDGMRLVGMLSFVRSPNEKSRHIASLYGMYVEPSYRGRRVGRALIDRAISKAKAMPGLTQLELSVAVDNVAALRLYDQAGFAPWGRHPNAMIINGETVDLYVMLLDVS